MKNLIFTLQCNNWNMRFSYLHGLFSYLHDLNTWFKFCVRVYRSQNNNMSHNTHFASTKYTFKQLVCESEHLNEVCQNQSPFLSLFHMTHQFTWTFRLCMNFIQPVKYRMLTQWRVESWIDDRCATTPTFTRVRWVVSLGY